MRPKLAVVFLLIVLLPLALLVWLGLRVARDEQEMTRHRINQLLTARLQESQRLIGGVVEEYERRLLRITVLSVYDANALRDVVRSAPLMRQILLLDNEGRVLHPPLGAAANDAEREFVRRTRNLIVNKELLHAAIAQSAPSSEGSAGRSHGWYTWHWEHGLSLIFWRKLENGRVLAAEVESARLTSDIIARLPETTADQTSTGGISLTDADGTRLYQWGRFEADDSSQPAQAVLSLAAPLHAWRLEYFAVPGTLETSIRATRFNIGVAIGAAALVLMLLATYFYREHTRQAREAAQRVSFVNQVSHELKTPLTNIRMYAELLEAKAEDSASSEMRRYLGIITGESQRLSRLIANVLTFAQQQKNTIMLHRKPLPPDEIIRETVEQFRPALQSKNIAIDLSLNTPGRVWIDRDAVGQILGNLISNVEKYAASGGQISISSAQCGDSTTITVSDRGPGISASDAARVFLPFERLSNALSDGVTGAGIGLSIARELARIHGGDLVLSTAAAPATGARFVLTLFTPVSELASGGHAPAASNAAAQAALAPEAPR